MLSGVGMHAEAAEALAERAQLSPQNPMIWNDLGVEYMAAGEPDAAYRAFVRAHKAFPDYPLPLYNLGRLALDRCIAEQARQSSPSELTRNLAVEAIGYLNECLYKAPLLYQAHALLSNAYDAVGDGTRANYHAQEASRLQPDEDEKPKRTWLQKVPWLRRVLIEGARPSPSFLASSDRQMHAGVN